MLLTLNFHNVLICVHATFLACLSKLRGFCPRGRADAAVSLLGADLGEDLTFQHTMPPPRDTTGR